MSKSLKCQSILSMQKQKMHIIILAEVKEFADILKNGAVDPDVPVLFTSPTEAECMNSSNM